MATAFEVTDEQMMARALELAVAGRGAVEPNPMVGCVVARDARVIGEGLHKRFGCAHAEPNALAACGDSTAGTTVYVTLEPCCHTNKQTPPCVPRLIAAKVSRVVIGCLDPNPEVAGRGMRQLRAAGIQVDDLSLPAARQLIAPFTATIAHARPYITLKWAQTADGKVAGANGKRIQISNEFSSRALHGLRGRSDAILVGIGTALADDPLLTVRLVEPHRPLIRIVLDRMLRLPKQSRLVRSTDLGRLIVYASNAQPSVEENRASLERSGVEVRVAPEDAFGRLSLPGIMGDIAALSVTHLLVEPGPTLARSIMQTSGPIWDRLWVVESKTQLNEASAPAAAPPAGDRVAQIQIGSDYLSEYLNPCSKVFFDPQPSVDIRLAAEQVDGLWPR